MRSLLPFYWLCCLILGGSGFWHSTVAKASPAFDEKYGLKKITVAVLNSAKDPIYSEAIERGWQEAIAAIHRFDFSKTEQASLKLKLSQQSELSLGEPENPQLISFQPLLQALAPASSGLQAVLLGEIKKADGKFGLLTVLLNAQTQEIVARSFLEIENPMRLDSFYRTAKASVVEIDGKIPFHATVLSRQGDRVVLDRGMPFFRQGMQVKTFTVEGWEAMPLLLESGRITITRVEKHLSFGKVIYENHPIEIKPSHKLVLTEKLKSDEVTLVPLKERTLASEMILKSVSEVPSVRRGAIGFVDAKIGFSSAGFHQSLINGTSQSAGNSLYPTATVLGEVFLTKEVFFDLGFQFANASISNPNGVGSTSTLGSSLTSWRGQVGYHVFGFFDDEPWIDAKLGYGSQKYSIGTAAEPFLFATSTYTGLIIGGAIRYPITPEIGVGLDVNLWLFPAISEFPVTGGSSASASGFDFGLKGYYRLNPQFTLEGRFAVFSNGANFEGTGTRPTSLTSADHSVKQFLVGGAYYF